MKSFEIWVLGFAWEQNALFCSLFFLYYKRISIT